MMSIAERRFSVAMVGFAALAGTGLSAPPSDVDGANARVRQELGQSLEECINASGREYTDARELWLRGDADHLQRVLAEPKWSSGPWGRVLVVRAIRIRLERPEECAGFDAMFERWIKRSMTMSIKQNSPVSAVIGDFCLETMSKDPKFEPVILERLLKYDDLPHVKQGIVRALGALGTEESLEPLLGLLRSHRPGIPVGRCARAIARISLRIGDTRAVRRHRSAIQTAAPKARDGAARGTAKADAAFPASAVHFRIVPNGRRKSREGPRRATGRGD